jgi:hypothetical protein
MNFAFIMLYFRQIVLPVCGVIKPCPKYNHSCEENQDRKNGQSM